MRAKLNQCKCGKTYNLNEIGTTETLCSSCNDKIKSEIRKSDILRKAINRNNEVSSNLERLSGIDE